MADGKGPRSRKLRRGNVVIFIAAYLTTSFCVMHRWIDGLKDIQDSIVWVGLILIIAAPLSALVTVAVISSRGDINIKVSDLFFQDSTQPAARTASEPEKFGKLPRFLQFAVLLTVAIAGWSLIPVLVSDTKYREEQTEKFEVAVANLSPEVVDKAVVRLWQCRDTRPFTLDDPTRDELVRRIRNMQRSHDIGPRGPWDYYRGIDLRTRSGEKYRIVLMRRKHFEGHHVLAGFQIAGQPIPYTLYFDAHDLWTWLQRLPPVVAQESGACKE